MRRTTLDFIVDAIAFVDLLCLAATGIVMKYVLPHGARGGYGRGFRGGRGPGEVSELLGLGRPDWGDIHFVLSVLFFFLMLVHLVLHWNWIRTCGKSILFPSRQGPCHGNEQTPCDCGASQSSQ